MSAAGIVSPHTPGQIKRLGAEPRRLVSRNSWPQTGVPRGRVPVPALCAPVGCRCGHVVKGLRKGPCSRRDCWRLVIRSTSASASGVDPQVGVAYEGYSTSRQSAVWTWIGGHPDSCYLTCRIDPAHDLRLGSWSPGDELGLDHRGGEIPGRGRDEGSRMRRKPMNLAWLRPHVPSGCLPPQPILS
jgi:hypothetical protein